MDEILRTGAISPLRQRMIEDKSTCAGFRAAQRNYVRDVGRYATFLGAIARHGDAR